MPIQCQTNNTLYIYVLITIDYKNCSSVIQLLSVYDTSCVRIFF